MNWKLLGILAAILGVLTLIVLYQLRPPPQWQRIQPGMTRQEVAVFVPKFDSPPGWVKGNFKYEERGPFTWELVVGLDRFGRVDETYIALWLSWPDHRKLYQF